MAFHSPIQGGGPTGYTGPSAGPIGPTGYTGRTGYTGYTGPIQPFGTVANGIIATVLTGVGPTGANTTVKGWLTFDVGSGVTGYVPYF